MYTKRKLSEIEDLCNHKGVIDNITQYIIREARFKESLNILEAGCGKKWALDLHGIHFTLTGVDLDQNALDIRMKQAKDLDVAILADLRTISLKENDYDIIFCENVLEHVDGAEGVLSNFKKWLKPEGMMILIFPNRDSAYAFVTRIAPFGIRVLYKKFAQGIKNAGKPGYDPYPVFFDKVISRNGIYEFCEKNGLVIKAEYRMEGRPINSQIVWFLERVFLWGMHLFSLKKLSYNYKTLIYVIEKP